MPESHDIEPIKRIFLEKASRLAHGERLVLPLEPLDPASQDSPDSPELMLERIGGNYVALFELRRPGMSLMEQFDLARSLGDPLIQIVLLCARTYLASVRREPDPDDIDRFLSLLAI